MKVTGERRYSHDLAKGGMEIPAENTNEKLVEFDKRRKIGWGNSLKKKEIKNKKVVLFICPVI